MAAKTTFVDDRVKLEALIDSITTTCSDNKDIPHLYIDLEGTRVSRKGSMALLTIMIYPQMDTYIVDITKLDKSAFTHKSRAKNESLKSILETEKVPKVFFDVRRDSDALFAHYSIHLAGVHDLQLMELAARPKHAKKQYLTGLGKCIAYDVQLSDADKQAAAAIKKKGVELFDPEKGGSYAVFDARPLSEDIKKYCVKDVGYMPGLWKVHRGRMSEFWWEEVLKETRATIDLSQKNDFDPYGPNMASAPGHWAGLRQ